MAEVSKCQEALLELANRQGYLTFDDFLHASETFSLSVTELDYISEIIQLRGVIVYENAPGKKRDNEEDEEASDYSRTDYEKVYAGILDLEPQLEAFIEEVKRVPPPQWGEVNILAKQSAEGNGYARERLITLYLRNVCKIALSMTMQYDLDIEDAIACGVIGLINAVDRYDSSGFSAFHSYASLWIQQGIQRDCSPLWMNYYFPAHFKDKMLRSYQKYEQYSAGEKTNSPEYYSIIRKISGEIGLRPNEVDKAVKACIEHVPVDLRKKIIVTCINCGLNYIL